MYNNPSSKTLLLVVDALLNIGDGLAALHCVRYDNISDDKLAVAKCLELRGIRMKKKYSTYLFKLI